jgi:hypothetical protein
MGRLYSKARWRRRRAAQLNREPLCAMCLREGVCTAATIADHVEPHRGDEQAFWMGRLQSLCTRHHVRDKQIEELQAQPLEVGADGWPTSR